MRSISSLLGVLKGSNVCDGDSLATIIYLYTPYS